MMLNTTFKRYSVPLVCLRTDGGDSQRWKVGMNLDFQHDSSWCSVEYLILLGAGDCTLWITLRFTSDYWRWYFHNTSRIRLDLPNHPYIYRGHSLPRERWEWNRLLVAWHQYSIWVVSMSSLASLSHATLFRDKETKRSHQFFLRILKQPLAHFTPRNRHLVAFWVSKWIRILISIALQWFTIDTRIILVIFAFVDLLHSTSCLCSRKAECSILYTKQGPSCNTYVNLNEQHSYM